MFNNFFINIMLSYLNQKITNTVLDIYYGYVEIKCVNCNNKFKMSRNKINKDGYSFTDGELNNSYSCNIGCALNYVNKIKN